jgi:hypothetical protein
MALDVYVKEDILRVLRALHVSSEVPSALAKDVLHDSDVLVVVEREGGSRNHEVFAVHATLHEERVQSYQKGFRTALASVALAFGLVPVSPATSPRHEVDLGSCLDALARPEP